MLGKKGTKSFLLLFRIKLRYEYYLVCDCVCQWDEKYYFSIKNILNNMFFSLLFNFLQQHIKIIKNILF
jgi:hypothetical protein